MRKNGAKATRAVIRECVATRCCMGSILFSRMSASGKIESVSIRGRLTFVLRRMLEALPEM